MGLVEPMTAGVMGSVAHQTAASMAEQAGLVHVEHEPLKEILAQIERHVAYLHRVTAEPQADVMWLDTLGDLNNIRYIEKKGHKYQAIFTASALQVNINVLGLGNYAVNLPAGWSFTPLPDKSEISLQTAGTQANVLFLATDDVIGVAI